MRTRGPLHGYMATMYLMVLLGVLSGLVGGIQLLWKPALWQQAAGLIVLVTTVGASISLFRWLARPVRRRPRTWGD